MRSPARLPLLLLLLWVVLGTRASVIVFRDSGGVRCGADQSCVSVRSCPEIVSVRQLVGRAICRFRGNTPFICCRQMPTYDGQESSDPATSDVKRSPDPATSDGHESPDPATSDVNKTTDPGTSDRQKSAGSATADRQKSSQPPTPDGQESPESLTSDRQKSPEPLNSDDHKSPEPAPDASTEPHQPQQGLKTTTDPDSVQETSPAPEEDIKEWNEGTCGLVSAELVRRRRATDSEPRRPVEEVIPAPERNRHRTGVVQGRDAAGPGRWPWMAALGRQLPGEAEPTWLCGAALLSARYVVTAAHCVSGDDPTSLRVRLGDHRLSTAAEAGHQQRRVARVWRHPEYAAAQHDIALLELERSVSRSATVRAVCLPPPGAEFGGRPVTLTGWGRLRFAGDTADVLQEAQLRVTDPAACEAAYRSLPAFNLSFPDGFGGTVVCAGEGPTGEEDACQGDSGGPLVHRSTAAGGRYLLVGVVSTGIGCGNPQFPGIYTRVASYVPWIRSIVFGEDPMTER